MPELPEVETVMRGLAPAMSGHAVVGARVNRPDLRFPLPDRMAERLTGARVLGLRRRAKYILADLSSGETLLVHLGMSGRMLVSGQVLGRFHLDHPPADRHDHVVLDMDCGARVTFNDARRFGAMDLMKTAEVEAHRLLAALGPEPLGNAFDAGYLGARLAGKSAALKSILLDQRVVAGLGNIYVCEVLHRAAIDPRRTGASVTPAEADRIAAMIRTVLAEAIEAGGSSLRDYRQASGELGYFQHAFRAYDRAGEPCQTGGCTGTIHRLTQAGRSTYYCPECQS